MAWRNYCIHGNVKSKNTLLQHRSVPFKLMVGLMQTINSSPLQLKL